MPNDVPPVVRPFKRLLVEAQFNYITNRAILVQWALNPAFDEPGPYSFKLQRGRSANDDQWVDIATVVDQPWLYDNNPVFGQFDYSTFYRVILTDGKGVIYQSQAVGRDVSWQHYDWRLAKEIIRKETLILRKKGGTRGVLLKRRIWGDPCTLCVDPSTNAIHNSHCPQCYGTGYIGGYYAPFDYWTLFNPSQRLKRLTNEGLTTAVMETVRALAYPSPEQNDVWVQVNPDRRFRIQSDVEIVARHRGVDLLVNLRLLELPQSDIIYTVPVTC